MKTNIPQELIDAYNATRFTVFEPSITIKTESVNESLDSLLEQYECDQWAYITSVNPFSETHTDVENEHSFESLKNDVSDYQSFIGEGVGTDPAWKPEVSLLILGISKTEAKRLGNKYGQNAIVYGKAGKKAELVLLQ